MSEARLLPLPSSLDKKRERKKKKKQLDTVGLKTGANHNLHFSSGERRSQSEGESAAQVPVRGDQSEEDSGGGESVANGNRETSARRRASWSLEGFWEAESEQKLLCRASRGSPWQRSGTRALPSQLAFANLYTKVLAAVRRIRPRRCKVVFTSQARRAPSGSRVFPFVAEVGSRGKRLKMERLIKESGNPAVLEVNARGYKTALVRDA